MTRLVLMTLLSHWRRRPLQLVLVWVGLSLATALWSGVQAINAEARAAYDQAASLVGRDRFDRLVAADGAAVSIDTYGALRRAGWAVSPVIEGRHKTTGLTLIGIDPLTMPAGTVPMSQGQGPGLAELLAPEGLLIANPETVAAESTADLPPLYAMDDLPPRTAIGDIAVVARLLGRTGAIDHLVIDPDAPPGLQPLSQIAPGLTRTGPTADNDLARLTDSFHLNLSAFGALAFVVGLFIAHSVIGLVFEQRRSSLRTLRALGVPMRQLVMAELLELGAIALAAGLAGVGLGYLVASLLLPDVAGSLRGLYGADVAGTLRLRPEWVLAALALTFAGAIVAAGSSLWQTARMPLLSPALPRAWARASTRRMARLGMLGSGFLVVAAFLVMFPGGLAVAFLSVAFLLIGAAFLLPCGLSLAVSRFGRKSKGVVAQWFWADTGQQLPGLSLALMALLLALASNVGVGTMVQSFRATFTGWLDQRLASELYLTTRSTDEASAILSWVGPSVDAVLPIASAEVAMAGLPGSVYGVADHPTYRDNWPLLSAIPEVWDALAAGRVALVNEQFQRRAGLGLGDRIDLPGGPLPIGGVYSDYGNPRPQALITQTLFLQRFPQVPILRFGLRVEPAKAAALADQIITRFDLPDGALVPQAEIKAYSLAVFERTFAVTGALNVLTLGIAAVALLASLLTLAEMRLPQLAPLWAIGLTRRRLATVEVLRILVLAALTLALAIPLGLALAWVLLARVNVAAFGWQLPMFLYPSGWLVLGLTALPAAALAAFWPAYRLTRLSPTELLKVFAHEPG